MKTDLFIVSPPGSGFAKALQGAVQELTGKKVSRVREPWPNRNNFIITQNVLNKIQQLERFKQAGVNCPPFCTRADGISSLGCKKIFARTTVTGTQGIGIVEFSAEDEEVPHAPLYTGYIPKKHEYRLHVFHDKVIDIQQKKRKSGNETSHVRNLANGYVYCRDSLCLSEEQQTRVVGLAQSAVRSCGYSYGACDIIWNESQDKYYVLEVNSRPGLMGTTLKNYAQALKDKYGL